jgi:hypothetical protein
MRRHFLIRRRLSNKIIVKTRFENNMLITVNEHLLLRFSTSNRRNNLPALKPSRRQPPLLGKPSRRKYSLQTR